MSGQEDVDTVPFDYTALFPELCGEVRARVPTAKARLALALTCKAEYAARGPDCPRTLWHARVADLRAPDDMNAAMIAPLAAHMPVQYSDAFCALGDWLAAHARPKDFLMIQESYMGLLEEHASGLPRCHHRNSYAPTAHRLMEVARRYAESVSASIPNQIGVVLALAANYRKSLATRPDAEFTIGNYGHGCPVCFAAAEALMEYWTSNIRLAFMDYAGQLARLDDAGHPLPPQKKALAQDYKTWSAC